MRDGVVESDEIDGRTHSCRAQRDDRRISHTRLRCRIHGYASATCCVSARVGLRTRRLRTGLSTLGVAIGIAAMVGVLGLSASSREELQTKIRALGTNLLEVQAGTGFGRGSGKLPDTAVAMVSRIGPVTVREFDRHRGRRRAAHRHDLGRHHEWHLRVRR